MGFFRAFLFSEGYTDPTPFNASVLSDFTSTEEKRFQEIRVRFETTLNEAKSNVGTSRDEIQRMQREAHEQSESFTNLASDAEAELARRVRRIDSFYKLANCFFATACTALAAFVEPAHLGVSFLQTSFVLLAYGWLLSLLLIRIFSDEYVAPFSQYLSSLCIIETQLRFSAFSFR